MRKLGILCMALVITLGTFGVGYATWSDNVTVEETVLSGTWEVELTSSGCDLATDTCEDATCDVSIASAETLTVEERRSRVELFLEFIADLDQNGNSYSAQISELDLSDADDLRASVADGDGAVYLHFGRGRYQEKFETYLEHRRLWQASGETVRAVDLRYRGQIVLNPEGAAEPKSQ